MEDNIISLTDELGNEISFEFLDTIEYEGTTYVVLLPVVDDDDDEPGEVVILQEDEMAEDEKNDDETSYSSVEDMEVLTTVFNMFKEKHSTDYNFIDEDE